jgi:hypothetical protein
MKPLSQADFRDLAVLLISKAVLLISKEKRRAEQYFRLLFAHEKSGFGFGVVPWRSQTSRFRTIRVRFGLEAVTNGPVLIDSWCQRGKQERKAVTLSARLASVV